MRSEQERLSRRRSPGRRIGGGGSSLFERDFGRLEEKADQTEARLIRLEDEVHGRNRESRELVVSWWQLLIVVLFTVGASLGSAWLAIAFGG